MAFGGWYVLGCDLRWYDIVQSEASSDEADRFAAIESCTYSQANLACLSSGDAVTEVLAPKFDATAGFQPTVLS